MAGATGRELDVPSPVLTGAGSRVCGFPHSQRRLGAPLSFPYTLPHRKGWADPALLGVAERCPRRGLDALPIGDSDLHIYPFSLGTNTFNQPAEPQEYHAVLDGFVERGGDFID